MRGEVKGIFLVRSKASSHIVEGCLRFSPFYFLEASISSKSFLISFTIVTQVLRAILDERVFLKYAEQISDWINEWINMTGIISAVNNLPNQRVILWGARATKSRIIWKVRKVQYFKKKSKQISLLVTSWVIKGGSKKFQNELERIFLGLFFYFKESINQNHNS